MNLKNGISSLVSGLKNINLFPDNSGLIEAPQPAFHVTLTKVYVDMWHVIHQMSLKNPLLLAAYNQFLKDNPTISKKSAPAPELFKILGEIDANFITNFINYSRIVLENRRTEEKLALKIQTTARGRFFSIL
jgi:hypothetical protein